MPDKRLLAAASLVRPGVSVCDVGTDHGYLALHLLREGISPRVTASDVNPGPLRAARRNARAFGESIRLVLSDGLRNIPPEDAQDIVICGMGGELIVRILLDCPYTRDPDRRLILQPMTRAAYLRRALCAEGFFLEKELPVLDGSRRYTVMRWVYDGTARDCSALFAAVGRIPEEDSPAADAFLEGERKRAQKIAAGLSQGGKPAGEWQALSEALSALLAERQNRRGPFPGEPFQGEPAPKGFDLKGSAPRGPAQEGHGPKGSAQERAQPERERPERRMIMPTVQDIYQAVDSFAPYSLAASWDNCGLQVGDPGMAVTGCVVALDVTMEALSLVQRVGANLLLTHHPVIFRPLSAIRGEDRIAWMLSHRMAAISAHTNLDAAEGGVNDALFAALGLSAAEVFPNSEGIGKIGTLPKEMSGSELARYLRERLGAKQVAYINGEHIRRVALGSGACGDLALAARDAGADALITGEVKHSEWVDAVNYGFPLFAAGHHETERVVLPVLRRLLEERFPELPCEVFDGFPVETL